MALGFNVTLRNNMLDEITAFAGGSAILRIYSGTQPATGGSETTILAQLTCNATFAAAASSGVLTLNSISSATSAAATGTGTWFRILDSGASTIVTDGTVSTTAAGTGDLQLDDADVVLGGTVAISTATITAGNA